MKRHLVYLTALLLVLLTACGGSGNTASDAGEMEGQSTNTSVSTADTAGGAETFEEEPQAAGESRFQNAKLIHTAHLEVETTALTPLRRIWKPWWESWADTLSMPP